MGPGLRRDDDLVVVPSCLGSQRRCFDSEFAKSARSLHEKHADIAQ